MLIFLQKIDSGNTLAEMCFSQINRESVFLKVMSEYPQETYLQLCKARYQVNAS